MTEYDYSEEGRRRQIETRNRITRWVRSTESSHELTSPFSASYHSGSSGSGRRHSRSTRSHHAPTHRAHQSYLQSQTPSHSAYSDSTSRYHSSSSHSSSRTSTVFPSHSISQAPVSLRSSSAPHAPLHSSHRPSHHSSRHHSHHHPPSRTYIVSPPPSAQHYRASGVIILPRHGQAPRVVVRGMFS
ncbi:hypothetical protein B0H16DRAFT_1513228 [Mycena metata]|uniref:Uncharacterized protein n=1 Tax=Mycena metata TaxID=1033252 RepID=A0AAD7JUY3_9AGAR|nr:hypothetical protein B0H16DRAFT_1513228 [Mycena metata]